MSLNYAIMIYCPVSSGIIAVLSRIKKHLVPAHLFLSLSLSLSITCARSPSSQFSREEDVGQLGLAVRVEGVVRGVPEVEVCPVHLSGHVGARADGDHPGSAAAAGRRSLSQQRLQQLSQQEVS